MVVTGCRGQVGTALVSRGMALGHRMLGLDSNDLDITDSKNVERVLARKLPDVVVNAAAYTAVDEAERHSEKAYAVNEAGARSIATVCEKLKVPVVHYSTDYVFDGKKIGGYSPDDKADPLSIYGKSKLAGDDAVVNNSERHLVIRTSWVFSKYRSNFVKTILRLARHRETIQVVSDQCGKPTAADEIARLTLAVIETNNPDWGTYHVAQPDTITWFEFAKMILNIAETKGMDFRATKIEPISSSSYPMLAERPLNSELDCSCFESTFGVVIKPWLESLDEVIGDVVGT